MTMQVAAGFALPPLTTLLAPGAAGLFAPAGAKLAEEDVTALMRGDAGHWLVSLVEGGGPLEVNERALDPTTVGELVLEFLAAQAVLAFRVPADQVMPKTSVGRVVVVEYAPWRAVDPPIPLLALLPLATGAVLLHNAAIYHLLTNRNATYIGPAMGQVLKSGIGAMSRGEAFFYYTKMLSLATGVYEQRYDTAHVLAAAPDAPPRRR
jgi:hypothetical protein